MFTKQEVQDIVISTVARQLELKKEQVKPESKLAEDLGADSLDLAEIMMDLEDEFDLMVSDDDAKAVKTISEAITYIEKQISSR